MIGCAAWHDSVSIDLKSYPVCPFGFYGPVNHRRLHRREGKHADDLTILIRGNAALTSLVPGILVSVTNKVITKSQNHVMHAHMSSDVISDLKSYLMD